MRHVDCLDRFEKALAHIVESGYDIDVDMEVEEAATFELGAGEPVQELMETVNG